MMIKFFIASITIAFNSTLVGAELKDSDPKDKKSVPSASAEHDCAPWDGPAFGIWLPAEGLGGSPRSWVYIKIWKRPEDSKGQVAFPSEGQRQIGNAMYFLDLESPTTINWQKQPRQELKGTVRFSRISSKENVLGELDFQSDKKVHIQGKFNAPWNLNHRPLCG